jgi:hypothetical protein
VTGGAFTVGNVGGVQVSGRIAQSCCIPTTVCRFQPYTGSPRILDLWEGGVSECSDVLRTAIVPSFTANPTSQAVCLTSYHVLKTARWLTL